MINENAYLKELQAGVDAAFNVTATRHPDVAIYTISIWTDEGARKSAVSFDTVENSQEMRRRANETWRELRAQFAAEGNHRRLALVPADQERNDNPADFEFRNVVVIENSSLTNQPCFDDQAWDVLEQLLEQVKGWAAFTPASPPRR